MTNDRISIRAVISGRELSRDTILAWEAKRLPRAAGKIGLPVPTGPLRRQRLAFADSKLALEPDEIRQRLARDLRLADRTSRATARLARNRRTLSVCDLHVSGGGNATDFVQWFDDTQRTDYTHSMVAANPDHFLIQTAPNGRQEVVETTGGSPLANRFFVDYENTATLVTPRDPSFSVQTAGVALAETGVPIGGVRHQFTDVPGGFRARVCVEFPRLITPRMISEHRWHLACEFSNWIEFAFGQPG
ncbi:hypothetical protein ABZ638_26825 [Streptomyces sp. NPDC007107]|uniref:hypothetical protein n=1 Tax=Streptomyces sp. NPDC007107 TaxID=3156915 RepID=UPI00340AE8ED